MQLKAEHNGELAARVRAKLGLTQIEMGEFMGMTRRAWQDKEAGINRVSVAEYHLFMLLLNEHEDYLLIRRLPAVRNPQQEAAAAALDLGQYLASGIHTDIPLPSEAERKLRGVEDAISNYKSAFNAETLDSVKEPQMKPDRDIK